MSRSGEISLEWGGEPDRTLRLGIGQLKKLQEKLDAGPLGIAAKCQISLAALAYQRQRDWVSLSRLDLAQLAELVHVRETLHQGLLGAGVPLPVADKLVREYVEERPLAENLIVTVQLCTASVYGPEDEQAVGEFPAAEEVSVISPAASSDSAKAESTPPPGP